ncbi:MAG: hypothetical protein ABIQ55_09965 [Gemmatimonadaceae bacterium]
MTNTNSPVTFCGGKLSLDRLPHIHMRSCFVLAVALAAAGCKTDSTTPEAPVTFRVTATITGTNTCAVNALEKSYGSIGQIAGDKPTKFVGTLDKNYHGLSCWVSADGGVTTTGGDGFFNIIFSGNTLGKPLAVGTYGLRFEIFDGTPLMMATIRFGSSSIGGDELRPLDNAQGAITVDSTANGTRNIHVDLQAVRYHRGL